MNIKETPGYMEGFYDAFAVEPEPLFNDAPPEYRAGWIAGIKSRELLKEVQ